ncbi:MAG: hypothetical protein ACO1N9_09345 [Flavobacterium sp.]
MEITQKALLLITSFFTGFGIVIPVLSFVKTKHLQKIAFKNLFILTAVQAVRVVGILYFLLFILKTFAFPGAEMGPWVAGHRTMISGQYMMLYWLPPTMYLILSQLLWIRKFYITKWILAILGILLLVIPTQWFAQLAVNIGKGLNAVKFTNGEASGLMWYILSVVIFIFTTFTIILATGKLKTILKQ